MVVDVDWHKYCKAWDRDETALELGFGVVGADDIRKGDWYYSDGYLSPCNHNKKTV